MEYTQTFRSDGKVIISRIIAKKYLKDEDDDVVHYITHWAEIVLYLPLNEIDCDGNMSKKWMVMLSLLKRAWEAKNTDIYAMKIMRTTTEFVLAIDSPPLNKTTSTEIMNFKRVDINELGLLLNNK